MIRVEPDRFDYRVSVSSWDIRGLRHLETPEIFQMLTRAISTPIHSILFNNFRLVGFSRAVVQMFKQKLFFGSKVANKTFALF